MIAKITAGSYLARSIHDPAIDLEAVDKTLIEISEGVKVPKWIIDHTLAAGEGQLPALPGEQISEIGIRILPATQCATMPAIEDDVDAAGWAATCVCSLDGEKASSLVLPYRVAIEMGRYAARANREGLSRPFGNLLQRRLFDIADGSPESKIATVRQDGVPKST